MSDELEEELYQHVLIHTDDGSVWNYVTPTSVALEIIDNIQNGEVTVGMPADSGGLEHILTGHIVCVEIEDYILVPRWKALLHWVKELPRRIWYV